MAEIRIRVQRAHLLPARALVAHGADQQAAADFRVERRAGALQDHDDVLHVLLL